MNDLLTLVITIAPGRASVSQSLLREDKLKLRLATRRQCWDKGNKRKTSLYTSDTASGKLLRDPTARPAVTTAICLSVCPSVCSAASVCRPVISGQRPCLTSDCSV